MYIHIYIWYNYILGSAIMFWGSVVWSAWCASSKSSGSASCETCVWWWKDGGCWRVNDTRDGVNVGAHIYHGFNVGNHPLLRPQDSGWNIIIYPDIYACIILNMSYIYIYYSHALAHTAHTYMHAYIIHLIWLTFDVTANGNLRTWFEQH